MQNQTDEIISLSVNNIFKNSKYIVPIYQRNYAWGESEIIQLIDDIHDYSKVNVDKNYYIGSLVVYKRIDGQLEVIDGQQRLTTLFILLNVLNHEFKYDFNKENINLHFESRKKSTLALKLVSNGNTNSIDSKVEHKIFDAYEVITKKLKNLKSDVDKFKSYFLNNVVILRTEVPTDTDLNHYFEIMNNRGEQLEKHEILKSRMLDKISTNSDEMVLFNLIWEACSNMEKYVQYSFPMSLRDQIFGKDTWNEFKVEIFENIILEEDENLNSGNKSFSISELVTGDVKIQNPDDDKKIVDNDTPERFTSVISFPNFLLHVLKIQEDKDKNIPLDDKRLLETFLEYYDDAYAVKKFAFNLLKLRFLFDKYVTKREYISRGDQWSLKQLIKNKNTKNNTAYYKNTFGDENSSNENKNILMLLTMFHVSYPTQIYKHWLSGVLNYLFNEEINQKTYREYLETLAKDYMVYRYLSENPLDLHNIIFDKNIEVPNYIKFTNLDKGTDVENFIFNYLDYLLWKNNSAKDNQFEFAFRTSVEHYYPQQPMEGIANLDKDILNSFGNLCLISSSENSRLSNLTPEAKKSFYLKQGNQSLKQKIMMENYEKWGEYNIKDHKNNMLRILERALEARLDENINEPK